MNQKQKRFAEEYVVDHNAAAAAIPAGYAESRARQTGSEMLAKPDVAQLVAELDVEKAEELGLEAREVIKEILDVYEQAVQQQPRIWKGNPVNWTDQGGEMHLVTDFRSAALAARMLELLFKQAGFDVFNTPAEHTREVVYTLHLDRDLSVADEDI